jgi:histidinol-phosphate/aromatic aminotransferase/cobyric acid decarboxylase-like protein
MDPYGLPGALRLTIGDEAANKAVAAALANFMTTSHG